MYGYKTSSSEPELHTAFATSAILEHIGALDAPWGCPYSWPAADVPVWSAQEQSEQNALIKCDSYQVASALL